MRLFLILLILSSIQSLSAQYYYKDILGTKESNQLFEKYRQLKVRSVVINSFEPDGNKSENFTCEQTFTPSNRSLKTYTKSGVTDESTLISYYDEKGILKSTVDSSANIVSKSYYVFNEENKLLSLKNISNEINKNFFETTEHFWFYNTDGKPVKMIRTTNIYDTLLVNFIIDENGNVTEEKSFKKGKPFSTVYYYYDTQNRMTDIVRYNTKAKRLLPDYLFEYSDTNQLIQKITVPANNSNYQIWRYQYNSNGLRIKEALYDKNKKLTGKIEYQYRFG
jgi:YD repeat-containing protein